MLSRQSFSRKELWDIHRISIGGPPTDFLWIDAASENPKHRPDGRVNGGPEPEAGSGVGVWVETSDEGVTPTDDVADTEDRTTETEERPRHMWERYRDDPRLLFSWWKVGLNEDRPRHSHFMACLIIMSWKDASFSSLSCLEKSPSSSLSVFFSW